jgi:hypothetical protein
MFHAIRAMSLRFCLFSYFIFILGYLGWPALCYCAEGHMETVDIFIGCMDDGGMLPDLSDSYLHAGDTGISFSGSNDTCQDVFLSKNILRNQQLNTGSFSQQRITGFFCFLPRDISSGIYPQCLASTRTGFSEWHVSNLRSVCLLI